MTHLIFCGASPQSVAALSHDDEQRARAFKSRAASLVGALHGLGPRPVLELLTEIVVAHDIGEDVLARIHVYRRLDPDIVAALGAREIQRPPLHVVEARHDR